MKLVDGVLLLNNPTGHLSPHQFDLQLLISGHMDLERLVSDLAQLPKPLVPRSDHDGFDRGEEFVCPGPEQNQQTQLILCQLHCSLNTELGTGLESCKDISHEVTHQLRAALVAEDCLNPGLVRGQLRCKLRVPGIQPVLRPLPLPAHNLRPPLQQPRPHTLVIVFTQLLVSFNCPEHLDQPEGGLRVLVGEGGDEQGGEGGLQPVLVLLQVTHPVLVVLHVMQQPQTLTHPN